MVNRYKISDPDNPKFSIFLSDESETLAFGQGLTMLFQKSGIFPAILFKGELGAGKTTMIRGIVRSLPGGEEAEVSSPSFNILNIYPADPEVAHFDLYRLEGRSMDPESEDILLDRTRLVLVEWSEFLSEWAMPDDALLINLSIDGSGRLAEVKAVGDVGNLTNHLKNSLQAVHAAL
ncbi:MAG: tRNA (adenosine(37)-N6)-threonylcarbamoyltransferase complex ATPase subunit type 1 TsaE [Desulfonatronovibrio sp.]|nr:tRNA (adenosine(37)-N6)-threonylcarbamoyltransferase complex ATPase subunit type 1 TsaE [Desulfovibrionales bacterium]